MDLRPMENIILVIHLILALGLIGIVLLQRSEGGGLGMGSSGGGGGAMTGRQAATALGKVTWAFAIGFFITSISLVVIAQENSLSSSVLDTAPLDAPAAPAIPGLPLGGDLLAPAPVDAPATPPRAN